MKKGAFVTFGLGIAILIAVLAPFLASPNPDGLESTAGKFSSAEGRDYSAFDSPLPDYTVPSLGEGGASGALAIASGTLAIFGLSYLFTKAIKRTRT